MGNQLFPPVESSPTLEVQKDGVPQVTQTEVINITGAGATVTPAGSTATVNIPGGGASPLTTKGDIFTYDTGDQRLAVGTDGQILSANSATGTGLEWIANTGGGGGGAANSVYDSFTDTNGTLITAHTPEQDTAGNGYQDIAVLGTAITPGSTTIQSNAISIANDQNGFGIDLETTDAIASFKYTPVAGQNNRYSLVLRYVDNNNHLLVDVRQADNEIRIREVVAGAVTQTVSRAVTLVDSNTYVIAALASAGTILVSVTESGNPTTFVFEPITALLNPLTVNGTVFGGIRDTANTAGVITEFTCASIAGGGGTGGGGGRPLITANDTLEVATTGNDTTGDGSPGSPFLTIQKAIDIATEGDLAPNITRTISVGPGTFTGFTTKTIVGQGNISIQGDGVGSTTIDSTSCIFDHDGKYFFGGFTLDGGGSLNMLSVRRGALEFNNPLDFLSANIHILVGGTTGSLVMNTDYSISGNAVIHLAVQEGAQYVGSGVPAKTVTLNGTPNFSNSFARALTCGVIDNNPTRATYSGAATGRRYRAEANGVIFAPTGGANYYPGNVAGLIADGGIYVG